MFEDRKDAGQKLALALGKYKDQDVIVLGIPRGGVEVGYYVAKFLHVRFSMVISRKLPLPHDPEAGFGAISEDGSTFMIERAAQWVSGEEIEEIKQVQRREIARRIQMLRKGRPLSDLKGKTVILVDDGIAMGVTMRAAIQLCGRKKAGKVVVAAPVAGEDVAKEIAETVDELVVLETPVFFHAVAQAYRHWYDVPDKEVLAIMDRWEKEEALRRA
ncbi:MAG: phosphoribosyltransferase [Omnitrophica bacterium RIFOXYB12_FULL_50_7]|nr:MAG: phosphoribosyltransferase [Omnitrophica bacterium RIFOXYB12_FULL_50_7]